MKTFGQFIKEDTQKKTLESDQFLSYLNTHCSDFATPWSNGKRIYRGSKGMYGALPPSKSSGAFGGLIIDTTSTTRKSKNTTNYYTLFLDYLITKEHSNFPLRSKSLICTTDNDTAMAFGKGNSIMVIPTNGCKIGEVGASDIWDLTASGNWGELLTLDVVNDQLVNANIIESIDSIREKSEKFKKMSEEELQKELPDVEPFFIKAAKKGLFESLTVYYTKILDKCTPYTPSNFSASTNHEVWVGNGDVVVFDSKNMDKLKVKNGKWTF